MSGRLRKGFAALLCAAVLFGGPAGVLVPGAWAADTGETTVSWTCPTIAGGTSQESSTYSEDWFVEDADTFNAELAKTSFGMAVSAFTESGIKGFFDKMDFSYSGSSVKFPTGTVDSIGYAIGSKKICQGTDNEATLIAVAVRGANYDGEWGSNMKLGRTGDHAGFAKAAEQVTDAVKAYVKAKKLHWDDVKIWMTGYSRGAAVANLAGAALDDLAGTGSGELDRDGVFVYCFATPQGASSSKIEDAIYDNLYNVIDDADAITKLPPSSWGFGYCGRICKLSDSVAEKNQGKALGKIISLLTDSIGGRAGYAKYESKAVSMASTEDPDSVSIISLLGLASLYMEEPSRTEMMTLAWELDEDAVRAAHEPQTYLKKLQASSGSGVGGGGGITIDPVEEPVVEPGEEVTPGPSVFADVQSDQWFFDAVNYVTANGLMKGTADSIFSPDAKTSRSMVVTVLYRLAGSPRVEQSADFSDLTADWYRDAVNWARAEKITTGATDKVFQPEGFVTREQLASFLYRYAVSQGMDVSVGEDTNILSYDDSVLVSEYAFPALQWACGEGIMNGRTKTTLVPGGTATRAELAAMLQRFCTWAEKNKTVATI